MTGLLHRKTAALVALALLTSLLSPHAQAAAPTKSGYLRNVQKEIDELAGKLRTMEAQSTNITGEQRERFNAAVAMLWQKERVVRVHLESLKHASGDRWIKLRRQEDSDLIHLRKSYRYVVNHYPVRK